MSKLAILIDGDNVEVHNLSAETAVNATTGQAVPYSSEIADMFTMQKGGTAPDHGQQGGSSSGSETRETISLQNGKHYDIPGGTVRTVRRLIRSGPPCEVQIHVKAEKDGMRIQLAGETSGEVTGGAAVGVGSRDNPTPAGTAMEGPLQSFDRGVNVKAGEYVTLFLRLDGGDSTVLLVVNPQ